MPTLIIVALLAFMNWSSGSPAYAGSPATHGQSVPGGKRECQVNGVHQCGGGTIAVCETTAVWGS